jgi:hypothetical protein
LNSILHRHAFIAKNVYNNTKANPSASSRVTQLVPTDLHAFGQLSAVHRLLFARRKEKIFEREPARRAI